MINKINVEYAFHRQVHFGEFTASYRTTDFLQTAPIDGNLKDLQLNSLTDLPSTSINIIKLQCIKPGIITIYLSKIRNFGLLSDKGQSIINQKSACTLDSDKASNNYYFQVFDLVGKTSMI